MKRRGFLGALTGLVVAPFVPTRRRFGQRRRAVRRVGLLTPSQVRTLEDSNDDLMNEVVEVTCFGDRERVFMTRRQIAERRGVMAATAVVRDTNEHEEDELDDWDWD